MERSSLSPLPSSEGYYLSKGDFWFLCRHYRKVKKSWKIKSELGHGETLSLYKHSCVHYSYQFLIIFFNFKCRSNVHFTSWNKENVLKKNVKYLPSTLFNINSFMVSPQTRIHTHIWGLLIFFKSVIITLAHNFLI